MATSFNRSMSRNTEKSQLVYDAKHQYTSQQNYTSYVEDQPFTINTKKLQSLVESKGSDTAEKIQQTYGSSSELCRLLKSGMF